MHEPAVENHPQPRREAFGAMEILAVKQVVNPREKLPRRKRLDIIAQVSGLRKGNQTEGEGLHAGGRYRKGIA